MNKLIMLLVVSLVIVFAWVSPTSEEAVAYSQGTIPPQEAKQVTHGLELKVATYNIHHGKNSADELELDATIKTLRALEADIIGLQEVEKMSPRSGFQNQALVIADGLDMHYRFEPALSIGPWAYGNVLLSRYPILDLQTYELTSDKENRIAMLATLDAKGKAIKVLVTHLGLNGKERKAHVEQLQAVLQAIQEPLLVLGDFNCQPGASELAPWLRALQEANEEPLVTFPGLGRQIDHILHSKQFTAVRAYTGVSDASDHVPLAAELKLL